MSGMVPTWVAIRRAGARRALWMCGCFARDGEFNRIKFCTTPEAAHLGWADYVTASAPHDKAPEELR